MRLSSRGFRRSSGKSLARWACQRRRGHASIRRRAAAFRYSARILADCTPAYPTCTHPADTHAAQPPGGRNQPVSAAARRPTRSTGIRGARRRSTLARRQDKPILLSIGYSACHWCHVMAHESFEDPATRGAHERAVRQHQGRSRRAPGPRPHLPDRAPGHEPARRRLAADDVPRTRSTAAVLSAARIFRPSSGTACPRSRPCWRRSRSSIARAPADVARARREAGRRARRAAATARRGRHVALDRAPLAAARAQLEREFDGQFGGFGEAPKFPHPMNLEFLLRTLARVGRLPTSPTCRRCTWRR